ncbi:MAG: respiratory nitrate reductase subunit gamma [Thermoproteus sp.]
MAAASPLALFLWVSFPYVVMSVFVVGHVYRYAVDQYAWTAKSSEIFEKGALRLGSQLFHWGMLVVIVGHLAGLLIPPSVTSAMGISEEEYHTIAIALGGASGLAAMIGALILLARRLGDPRVRATSDPSDILVLVLIVATGLVGLYNTLVYDIFVGPFDYRRTIGAWIRSLLAFQPDPAYMASVPITFQIHIVLAYLVFLMWPFTRLVHVWSYPIFYLERAWIIYRRLRAYD